MPKYITVEDRGILPEHPRLYLPFAVVRLIVYFVIFSLNPFAEVRGETPRSDAQPISLNEMPRFVATDSPASSTVALPATKATGIALASAGQYQVLSDAQWKDYEDVPELAVLNGIKKAAANSGQEVTTVEYGSISSLLRTQLDASALPAAKFLALDEGGRLRYAIDSLSSLASSPQAGSLLPIVLFGLEKTKFTN